MIARQPLTAAYVPPTAAGKALSLSQIYTFNLNISRRGWLFLLVVDRALCPALGSCFGMHWATSTRVFLNTPLHSLHTQRAIHHPAHVSILAAVLLHRAQGAPGWTRGPLHRDTRPLVGSRTAADASGGTGVAVILSRSSSPGYVASASRAMAKASSALSHLRRRLTSATSRAAP